MLSDVRAFHERMQVSKQRPFPKGEFNLVIKTIGELLCTASQQLESLVDDGACLRAHLMSEELGEFLVALGEGHESLAFDALLDLLYVCVGTADMYDWPLEEGWDEVQRSNMSKEKQPDDPAAERVRDKGPNYSPPDLFKILEAHRCRFSQ